MATRYRHSARLSSGARRDDALARPLRSVVHSRSTGRRVPPAAPPRHMAYALALATVSLLAVANSVAGGPIAAATSGPQQLTETAAVADALGIDPAQPDAPSTGDRRLLEQLAVSRAERDASQAAAAVAQAQSEEAAAAARAEAEARAAAEAAAAEAAAAAAEAAEAEEAEAAAAAGAGRSRAADPAPSTAVASSAVARVSNSAGAIRPQAQAAANMVVSNVPGAGRITIGGTRPSAADPGGHPSGLALDYMVGSDTALGDAIAEYHIAHWDELGVDYIIWKQRMLSSPSGAWKMMENRGSATANHMDHPHVNYLG